MFIGFRDRSAGMHRKFAALRCNHCTIIVVSKVAEGVVVWVFRTLKLLVSLVAKSAMGHHHQTDG